ncbi:hypothetical protein MHB44_07300 [Lysinibacillus sp. FSL H8-0500]|uniref:hypothetical protein n=1 Tax=Lysinibacillus TaxID=400634 RepID=UPI000A8A861B|nr:hypothetical protein [Lysinibacillus macroides]QPR70168.1 hypothetical protein I6G82_11670 [Lysinibacillus macroides]
MENNSNNLEPKAINEGPYYITCENKNRNCCYTNADCLNQYKVFIDGRKVAYGCCQPL